MSLKLKPYTEYKDSGIPWLGPIPKSWDIGPGFSAFREKKLKNTGLVENTVLSLSYGRIVVKPPEKLHGLVPVSFETYQIVDPGEIIIRPTDLQNDWNSLRVGISRHRGIITSAYICLQATGPFIPDYCYRLILAYDLMKVFYGMWSGLRQNLDFSELKRMPVVIPSKAEQRTITGFLNHFDRQINRLIRAKRRLIELLNEQKQIIIHQAVTRGLDPNVRLKPSGIEWLGDVPEHWRDSRLKFETTHIVDCIHATPEYTSEGEYPAIRTADIEPGKLRLETARRVTREQYEIWTSRLVPRSGDILYSREGERYGLAALVPNGSDLCISQRMMVFRILPPQD
jgi:type I restriction enzyme S subunit